ncbi:MAG: TetR/AcrR family transcriptional regulator [Clostridiales bacterium]|nr:TetR/AcrR family transcriptional regulator [Clostridiales bacterium]
MSDTKEKILLTALRLFARDGYEAVSVSAIAGELGMTKGALYKHYKNKRDIFDHIVARMFQVDAERSRQYEVPEEQFDRSPSAYEQVTMENIRRFTLAQFVFWTEDEFASDFRKMLTLEQYRSAEMAELYSSCLVAGPVAYMEDIFREMLNKGALRAADPKQLALEFFAPLYLLINMWDQAKDRIALAAMLDDHIARFIQLNAAKDRKEKP